jgi:hypothetical protein
MKFLGLSFLLILAVSLSGYFFWYKPKFDPLPSGKNNAVTKIKVDKTAFRRVQQKASLLLDFSKRAGYDTNYCFLVDMRIASGKKRFFVYNLQADSIELAGLVTHGSGSDKDGDAEVFSNKPQSYCTSLGTYKIGNDYMGRFGLAYKLSGLDVSNSKAYERNVVLHAHACVPNEEVYPLSICQSLGCPTVSPSFLEKLKYYLENAENPILLEIYH